MLVFAAKRIFFAFPILLGVSLLVFGLVNLAPGDAADMFIPPDVSKDVADAFRRRFGLDQPLYMQYALWLSRIVVGDFGISIFNSRPVLPDVLEALSNTLQIALPAAALAFVLGSICGGIAGFHQNTWTDRVLSGLSISAVSIPNFWLAIALVAIFSVKLDLLPAVGMGDQDIGIAQKIRFMVLPIVALTMIPFGIISRFVRAMVLEILEREFVDALHAKGMLSARIVWHVAKNAAPPTLALMGLQFGYLLGGSILVEAVFNWPGVGGLLNLSIFRRDIPSLSAIILVLATIFVVINIGVDLVQALIDPRIRR
jgi:peptide/nickel transport system permease protein